MDKNQSADQKDSTSLNRRTYLKGIGTTAAFVGGLSGSAAAAQDSNNDYEVIKVSPGETWTYNLEPGETFENYLIDITANNADWQIRMHGDDMTVRNIGVRGNVNSPKKRNQISVANTSPSSESLIENVYFEGYTLSGFNNAVGTGGTATPVFVAPNHAGDLLIRNVNFQSTPDNHIYGSAPGNGPEHPAPGNGGTVRVEDSYFFRTGAGAVRLGTEGSYAKNCIMDGDVHNTAANNSRPFWGYYEKTKLYDCDLMNGSPGAIVAGSSAWKKGRNAEIIAENCYFEDTGKHAAGATINGTSADRKPRTDPSEIDGVPLSPEEAASGSASSSAPTSDGPSESEDETQENVLVFDGSGQGDDWKATDYRFAVEGEIEPSEHDGASIDPELELDDGANSVEHTVANWKDAFTFDGELLELDVDGPATVYLNGEEIDPATFGGEEVENEESMPSHALVIDGTDASGLTSYSFSVSGEVVKANHRDASIDDGDVIDGQSVSGTVANWRDAYWFSGDITDFWMSGDANVDLEYDARDQ